MKDRVKTGIADIGKWASKKSVIWFTKAEEWARLNLEISQILSDTQFAIQIKSLDEMKASYHDEIQKYFSELRSELASELANAKEETKRELAQTGKELLSSMETYVDAALKTVTGDIEKQMKKQSIEIKSQQKEVQDILSRLEDEIDSVLQQQHKFFSSSNRDRKSTRLNSSHSQQSRMPSSA